jgi:aryl sulfotransferase
MHVAGGPFMSDASEAPGGRIVWLASFPKSGNTWVRAIVTALATHRHLFQVDQLSSGSQPFSVGGALWRYGIDVRWLDRAEVDRLRTALILGGPTGTDGDAPCADDDRPILRKTHEVHRTGPPDGRPFPIAATRATVLVVRDPRDVACSWAPFFGVSLDEAVEAIGKPAGSDRGSPFNAQSAQPWGSWSSHVASWLADEVPFPVHLVRYEDLQADAVGTLAPVFAAIGLVGSEEDLSEAVDRARFDRLRKAESERGFRETSRRTATFFRRGTVGGWRDELTADQVAAIEADHGEWMQRLGYELTTDLGARSGLAESRASRRRQQVRPWSQLPPQLGIEVVRGEVPEELPDAQRPRPWIQATPTATRVSFGEGRALLVENGARAVVQWREGPDESPDADLSWLVQGWAVTLASLQRGRLSLHASTVRIGEEIVALAGQSGAGKSTTAMGLRALGHELLIDDTTIIEFRDGGAWTTPYSRNVHLLPDAAEAVGVSFEALPALAGRFDKVAFLPEEPADEPHRIDRVVVLTRSATASEVSVREARGGDRVQALFHHVSRRGVAPAVLGRGVFFERLAQLANSTRIQVLQRPSETWTLDAVLDAVVGSAVTDG